MAGGTSSSERLQRLLGLSDEELMAVLGSSPLDLISGAEDEREDLRVLVALVEEAEEQVGPAMLRRWLRAGPLTQRPLDLLARQDFPGFEAALAELTGRGFVLRAR